MKVASCGISQRLLAAIAEGLTGGLFMSIPEVSLGLAAICAGGLLAGCFSASGMIPDDWAEPIVLQGDDCPAIDGTYRNAGETYEPDYSGQYSRHERSLAHILNGGTGRPSLELWNRLGPTAANPSEDRFDSVSLRLANGQLHVSAADTEGDGRTMSLPVHVRCQDSVLALDVDRGTYFKGPSSYEDVGRISLALGRAEDGSLLLRETEAGTYIFLFMPVFAYREEAWTRFAEAPATVVAAESP
jgi:hypothetical protein